MCDYEQTEEQNVCETGNTIVNTGGEVNVSDKKPKCLRQNELKSKCGLYCEKSS